MKKWLISLLVLIVLLIVGYKIYDRYFYSGEFVVVLNEKAGLNQAKIYHRVDCPIIKKAPYNSIAIVDKEKLARNDFRACKTCNPPYDAKYVANIKKIVSEEKRIAKLKEAEEHKKYMEQMKQKYIGGEDRSVWNAMKLYEEKYLTKNDLIKYRATTIGFGLPSVEIAGKEYEKITKLKPIKIIRGN